MWQWSFLDLRTKNQATKILEANQEKDCQAISGTERTSCFSHHWTVAIYGNTLAVKHQLCGNPTDKEPPKKTVPDLKTKARRRQRKTKRGRVQRETTAFKRAASMCATELQKMEKNRKS